MTRIWVFCPTCQENIMTELRLEGDSNTLSWHTWGHACYNDGVLSDRDYGQAILAQIADDNTLAGLYIAP